MALNITFQNINDFDDSGFISIAIGSPQRAGKN